MKKSIANVAPVVATPVVVATPEQQAQVLLDGFNADFDLDIAIANAAIASAVAPTPVAKAAKRVAVLNVEAIKSELAPVLGIKKLSKMLIKFGNGTCAIKLVVAGQPTRNVLTLNEVYRNQDGTLVMALNLNSLPIDTTKLPEGVVRKTHSGYFKHNGLTLATVAQIVKLNF